MQFKVGDRVVSPRNAKSYSLKEWSGTVIEVYSDDDVHIKADEGSPWSDRAEELVLEEIYNSPLYRALQEE